MGSERGVGQVGVGSWSPPSSRMPCYELAFSWKGCHFEIPTKGTYRLILALGGVWGSVIVSQRKLQMSSVLPSSGEMLCCTYFWSAPKPFMAPYCLWDKGQMLQCDIQDLLRVEVNLGWDSNWPLGSAPAWSYSVLLCVIVCAFVAGEKLVGTGNMLEIRKKIPPNSDGLNPLQGER